MNTAANGTGPSETADDDLPSVMTCANYLKLPPYSTKVLFNTIAVLKSGINPKIFILFHVL